MRLTDVHVAHFRSVAATSLRSCGNFNVLVGKNNAGKSTLLSGIAHFFGSIEGGEVARHEPTIGGAIDFHNQDTSRPIELAVTFALIPSERTELVEQIIDEAPQLKHALGDTTELSLLRVTVQIHRHPHPITFVRRIELAAEPSFQDSLALLVLDPPAAQELAERLRDRSQAAYDAQELMTIRRMVDRSDWRNLATEERGRSYYLGRSATSGSPMADEAKRIASAADSYEEFLERVQAQIAAKQTEGLRLSNETLANPVMTFGGESAVVPTYAQQVLQRASETRLLHLREHRKQIGEDEAQRLLNLKMRRGGSEQLQRIQQTVASLLGASIDVFSSGRGVGARRSEAEMDVDNFLIQANGSGIRESLRLLLDYEFEQPHLLLIEEPEVHLHPALETAVMQYLKQISRDCQVFITTHSTNFVDRASIENVYIVSRHDSTSVQTVQLDEAESRITKELGLTLSALFMYDRLVFVEGPTDESVLQALATTLRIPLSQANVGFVPMGGARNLGHFAAEATLEFLAKRQVALTFVIDRDEMTQDEVERLQSVSRGYAKVHVLEKRELENYLVIPRAVAELCRLKAPHQFPLDDASALQEKIGEIMEHVSDGLREATVGRRVARKACSSIHIGRPEDADLETFANTMRDRIDSATRELEERKRNLDEDLEKERRSVAAKWENHRLNVVPGDELLDGVLKEFSLRFNKRQDGPRLAPLLQPDEIASEIQDLLRKVVS